MDKADILNALTAFAEQPPNLNPDDYNTPEQYNRDHRRWCDEPLAEFKAMREIIAADDAIDAEDLSMAVERARRISMTPEGVVEYIPGQHGALEYRTAAANALSEALLVKWVAEVADDAEPLPHAQDRAEQMLGETVVERYFR